jgi:hypothetical protein
MNIPESVYDFYKLKSCIEPERIQWWKLVTTKNAFPFIEKHIDILDDDCLKKLSRNPFAVDMLVRHIDKISWVDFVLNPNAIHVIEKNLDLCFKSLCGYGKIHLLRHPDFIHILKKYKNKFIDELLLIGCLSELAKHTNPIYIDLLEKYMKKCPEKIQNVSSTFWDDLCVNANAVHIIKENLDKLTNLSWQILAKNPNAIHIISQNLEKLDDTGWRYLSQNPNAIPILEENIDKINWYSLSSNINGIQILEKNIYNIRCYSFIDYENMSVEMPIFEIDYDAIEKRCSIYKEELIAIALHPSRIEHYLNQGIPFKDLDNYI